MKKSILSLLVAALALVACAESVTPDMAVAVANAWAAKNGAFGAGSAAVGRDKVRTERDVDGVVLWHQVSMQDGGMLVVAPVTEIEPVVMALDDDPGELPVAHPLRGILSRDMRRRLSFLGLCRASASTGPSLQGVAPLAAVSEEARAWGESGRAKWARLGVGAALQEAPSVGLKDVAVEVCVAKGFEKGGALTHWNQGDCDGGHLYNYYTPNNAVCGCVATACAALAQFYGTTNAVAGVVGKKCTYNGVPYAEYFGRNAVTKGGAIDWSSLPKKFGGTNTVVELTSEQRQLIGRVAFDAGVGVNMMWTDGESGAFESSIASALKDVFGFRNARYVGISNAENPPQEELEKLIYNQCRAGAPVGLGIEGHSVVAVGYGLDADNVERVRIFMGWAGSGDGWYALPKVDTKATTNGGSYLSEIVDGVITMISYDDDDIVPIAGHVSMPGAALEIPALDRMIGADGNGYFATRVPPNLPEVTVVCMGKEAKLDIGADAAKETDAAKLCAALPEAFEFSLLNATVAYDLRHALLYAKREGKAILRISGTSTESNTIAVLNYIYELDDGNVNDFTNRFVYVFSSANKKEGDGGSVSYGVYLPEDVATDGGWQAKNGTLSRGYALTIVKETNFVHSVTNHATELEGDTSFTTNTFVYTIAPFDSDIVVEDFAAAEFDAITNALVASVEAVVNAGWTRYAQASSGITVEEISDPEYVDVVHERCYADGDTVELVCGAEVTNETAGVVYGCAGWSTTNRTTGAVLKGTGNTASFAVAKGDEIVLTWDLTKKVAVHVDVSWSCEVSESAEAVEPLSGWYPCGEPVVFSAKESVEGCVFNKWQGGLDGKALPDGCLALSPTTLYVPMDVPCEIYAYYKRSGSVASVTTNTVSVTATSWFFDEDLGMLVAQAADAAPTSMVYAADCKGAPLASGESMDVLAAGVVVRMGDVSYHDADGNKWKLVGWTDDEALDNVAAVDVDEVEITYHSEETSVTFKSPSTDVEVKWIWMSDNESVDTEFDISWDPDLTTLNAHGYSTNLLSKAQLEASGVKLGDVTVNTPKGFKPKLAYDDEGNLVATLVLDEEVLQPFAADGEGSPLTILSNGDGTVTVKADVANGVTGFWYSLYAADDLGGPWNLVKDGEYDAGDSSLQAKKDGMVSVSIDVTPAAARKFYKLVVTDVAPTSI